MEFAVYGQTPREYNMKSMERLPLETSGAGLGLLSDVTVVDLTTSVAGPYGTQLLADLGATVIKVEKPSGDDTRGWGPPFLNGESLWYLSVNRNKESVQLDISHPAGRAVLRQLVASADVLIVNLVARVQRKLGIDWEALSVEMPGLIHCSLTGFGLKGGRQDLPCYDLIAEGYSGVMDLTGEADQLPQKVGTPAADLLAGQDAALAVLAALHERQRTGRGKQIDISMVHSMTRFMAPRLVPYMGSGELPRRSGGRDSVIAIYQVFQTADLPMTLGLGNDAIWARFWQAVGMPEYAACDGFASNADRRERRDVIVARIAEILAREPRAHWLELLGRHRVPAGPINGLDEVLCDAELLSSGIFYTAEGPAGPVPQVGLGISFDGCSRVHRSAPPALGEHTESVLRGRLGMSDADVARMRREGII